MKKLGLISGILALALVGLAVNSTAHSNKKNCETRLVGNLYMCQGVDRNGSQYEFDLFFGASNESSFSVELLVSNETSRIGACGCQAAGSLRRPRFDREDDFICAIPNSENQFIALTGEAEKKKIDDGQLLLVDNSTLDTLQLLYECKIVR